MRRLTAGTLCVALQVGAFTASFVHAHPDDEHADHHEASAVHAHFGGHSGDAHELAAGSDPHRHHRGQTPAGPAVGADPEPERTTTLQIFVAVQPAASPTPALPPARFTVPEARESWTRQPPDLVRSHGPPDLNRAAPRAPPAPSV